MNYLLMTVEEAQRLAKKNALVLVAVSDLEKEDCNEQFTKRTFGDCNEILKEAETIANVCDDFVNQLRIFSKRQVDVINYENKGKLSTILLPKIE